MVTERHASPGRFSRVLHHLKRDGCNLLLVGVVPEEKRRRACRRLFGAADERRRRVFVTPDETTPATHLPGGGDHAGERVVHHHGVRGSTTATSPSRPLSELGRRVEQAVDEVTAVGVEPGELRLGVNTLEPLLASYSVPAVKRFVDRVSERVVADNGMGHYVLPVPREDAMVEQFAPSFDAVLEHRVGADGTLEERWHVAEPELTSGWVGV